MNSDGTDIRRFTDNAYRDRNPAFSFDDKLLIWDSVIDPNTDGHLRAMDISDTTATSSSIVDLTPYVAGYMDAWGSFSASMTPTADGEYERSGSLTFSSNRGSTPSVNLATDPDGTDFEVFVADFLETSQTSMSISNITTVTDNASWSHQSDFGTVVGGSLSTPSSAMGFVAGYETPTTVALYWDDLPGSLNYEVYDADTLESLGTTTASTFQMTGLGSETRRF